MTVQDLNRKAERLVELYKEKKNTRRCRSKAFKKIFGDSIFAKDYWDQYICGSPYPQDDEINELIREMDAGMRELGFSKIFDTFCVEYLLFKTREYDFGFEEYES